MVLVPVLLRRHRFQGVVVLVVVAGFLVELLLDQVLLLRVRLLLFLASLLFSQQPADQEQSRASRRRLVVLPLLQGLLEELVVACFLLQKRPCEDLGDVLRSWPPKFLCPRFATDTLLQQACVGRHCAACSRDTRGNST